VLALPRPVVREWRMPSPRLKTNTSWSGLYAAVGIGAAAPDYDDVIRRERVRMCRGPGDALGVGRHGLSDWRSGCTCRTSQMRPDFEDLEWLARTMRNLAALTIRRGLDRNGAG